MARLSNRTRTRAAIGGLLILVSLSFVLAQRQGEKQELTYVVEHRVNAHGDEFNALAKSSDDKQLFTATEKGEIVVWNIASNRLERTLRQSSAIHLIASLADRSELVAAGSNHLKPFNALARKWNVETGEFVDLPGVDSDASPLALATETASGLIALTTRERKVLVWDARTYKQLADWTLDGVPIAVAVLGRDVYVAMVDPEYFDTEQTPKDCAIVKLNVDNPRQGPADFMRVPGRVWTELAASPDYRLLRAKYRDGDAGSKNVVIDPQSKQESGSFGGEASLWIDAGKLMLFDWMDPVEIVQVSANEPAKSVRKFERFESDTRGRAFELTGQVSNADGSKAWASYRKGPGLLEFDVSTKKIKTLIGGPSGAYTVSVLTEDGKTGEVLTGGADGYVRLWKLADLSLIKEYKIGSSEYFVRDAVLVPGSRRAVVGIMRMDWQTSAEAQAVPVILLDLETGQQKKLFEAYIERTSIKIVDNQIVFAELGRIKFATLDGVKTKREFVLDSAILRTALSANNRWLAVIDYSKKLTVFDLTTGQKRTMPIPEDADGGPAVITNDGKYVYTIGHEGSLTTWDVSAAKTTTNTLAKIREMHSNVDFITLANDDRWLVTTGNHQDVGIFDRATLRPLFYMRTGGAVWYVEKVWIKGDRMIMTTDIGVMYSSVIK